MDEGGDGLAQLGAAGLDMKDAAGWAAAEPRARGNFTADGAVFANYWRLSADLLARLPAKPRRNDAEQAAAELIKTKARHARVRFMAAHGEGLYDNLTGNRSRFLRLEELLAAAAAAVDGLAPSPEAVKAESGLPQRDKDGIEIDQGLFLSAVLGSEQVGNHLCHAMLLPRREAIDLLPQFTRDGTIDLGTASVERHGNSAVRDHEESAVSQRRGSDHDRADGNLRRSRAARSSRSPSACCAAARSITRSIAVYSAPE